jgi:hypothetical protein
MPFFQSDSGLWELAPDCCAWEEYTGLAADDPGAVTISNRVVTKNQVADAAARESRCFRPAW